MLSFACGTRDKVHMRRPAPAALRDSHPKCAEQSSAHQLFLSAKARRKFDAGWLTLLDVVDADPAQKLYRYRMVPGRGAGYKVCREFRTQRRPLNVAFVLRRTVEQETLYPAPPVGDRTHTATASCSDRRRRRTARFPLGRIYGGQPPRSWRRCRCMPREAAPSRGCPGARAS